MNNYWDKYSRIHHKPCLNGEPSSNNGWIYTAYYRKAAGILVSDYVILERCFRTCRQRHVKTGATFFTRHPYGEITDVPFNRDEIIGGVHLSLIREYMLLNKFQPSWNFSPFPIPKFSPIKLAKQLWELRPSLSVSFPELFGGKVYYTKFSLEFKHRNYFWENNLDQLYRFAFSVPIQDRHFILKCWEKFQWYNPAHLFYAAVAKIDSMLPKKSGIKWLKYGGEENKKAMVQEFPSDHDIRVKLGL